MGIEEKINFLVELAQSKSTDPDQQISYLKRMAKLKLQFAKSYWVAYMIIYEHESAIDRIKNGMPSTI